MCLHVSRQTQCSDTELIAAAVADPTCPLQVTHCSIFMSPSSTQGGFTASAMRETEPRPEAHVLTMSDCQTALWLQVWIPGKGGLQQALQRWVCIHAGLQGCNTFLCWWCRKHNITPSVQLFRASRVTIGLHVFLLPSSCTLHWKIYCQLPNRRYIMCLIFFGTQFQGQQLV